MAAAGRSICNAVIAEYKDIQEQFSSTYASQRHHILAKQHENEEEKLYQKIMFLEPTYKNCMKDPNAVVPQEVAAVVEEATIIRVASEKKRAAEVAAAEEAWEREKKRREVEKAARMAEVEAVAAREVAARIAAFKAAGAGGGGRAVNCFDPVILKNRYGDDVPQCPICQTVGGTNYSAFQHTLFEGKECPNSPRIPCMSGGSRKINTQRKGRKSRKSRKNRKNRKSRKNRSTRKC
jgi:hypothetical protein